jgi:triacylglycerol lipase
LRKIGYSKFYEFCYKKRWGNVKIEELSRQLSFFIEQEVKEKKIDIIGISQGGIIARHYIQHHKKIEVQRCITLCSPHKGSLTAYLLFWMPCFELRPGSGLLSELNNTEDDVKYYCVYNPLDLMVFPGKNAFLERAVKNKKVISLLHPFTFSSQRTLEFINECLNEKD